MRGVYRNLRLLIPEIERSVRLRKWSCEEREHYFAEIQGQPHAMAWVFAHSVADDNGERAFSDFDIGELSKLSSVLLNRVCRSSLEYNGIYGDFEKRATEFKESYEKRAWFTLAGHLGHTVAWCKRNVSFDEFQDWLVYMQHRPIGEDAADLHAAMVCHAIVAVVPRRRGSKAPKLEKFIPVWWKPPRKSQEQVQDLLHSFFCTLKNSGPNKERIGDG